MGSNKGLQNELSALAGLASLGLYLVGKRKWAAIAGAGALGLKFFPPIPFSYHGKSVVITGGSRGLGFVLAQKLLAEGANVTLIARDQLELDRAWAKLTLNRQTQNRLFVISADVTDLSNMKSALLDVKQRYGRIDILINNAGSISAGPIQSMNKEDFEAQMNIHLYGAMNSVEATLPHFSKRSGGQIVNITSIGGKVPVPHLAPYCASKFALAGYSQTLGVELMKENVKVLTVYPGLMRTGSAIQAVLKGDHEKEFAWFAVANSTPGFSMAAEKAAQQIVNAIRDGRTELCLSAPSRLALWAQYFFPETLHAILGAVNEFLPSRNSQERKTGAESQAWLKAQPWSRPVQKVQELTQQRYNEQAKTDANYNMNIK